MPPVPNIRLPDTPVKGMQLECNGNLSLFNARIEKNAPVKAKAENLNASSATADSSVSRALEAASQIRQNTISRQQDKEAKMCVPPSPLPAAANMKAFLDTG
jgi:hypothetical protein